MQEVDFSAYTRKICTARDLPVLKAEATVQDDTNRTWVTMQAVPTWPTMYFPRIGHYHVYAWGYPSPFAEDSPNVCRAEELKNVKGQVVLVGKFGWKDAKNIVIKHRDGVAVYRFVPSDREGVYKIVAPLPSLAATQP